jgi:hypothetical protein
MRDMTVKVGKCYRAVHCKKLTTGAILPKEKAWLTLNEDCAGKEAQKRESFAFIYINELKTLF